MSDQSDTEPDSNSEDLGPATDAAEAELNGTAQDRQSSCYSLRARIDPPERLH